MDRLELISIYKDLENLLGEYNQELYKFRNGKNKKIRAEGERKIDILLDRAKHKILNNPIIHGLFNEEAKESGAPYEYFVDEFFNWDYFHKDMREFLERIKNYVEGMG